MLWCSNTTHWEGRGRAPLVLYRMFRAGSVRCGGFRRRGRDRNAREESLRRAPGTSAPSPERQQHKLSTYPWSTSRYVKRGEKSNAWYRKSCGIFLLLRLKHGKALNLKIKCNRRLRWKWLWPKYFCFSFYNLLERKGRVQCWFSSIARHVDLSLLLVHL